MRFIIYIVVYNLLRRNIYYFGLFSLLAEIGVCKVCVKYLDLGCPGTGDSGVTLFQFHVDLVSVQLFVVFD